MKVFSITVLIVCIAVGSAMNIKRSANGAHGNTTRTSRTTRTTTTTTTTTAEPTTYEVISNDDELRDDEETYVYSTTEQQNEMTIEPPNFQQNDEEEPEEEPRPHQHSESSEEDGPHHNSGSSEERPHHHSSEESSEEHHHGGHGQEILGQIMHFLKQNHNWTLVAQHIRRKIEFFRSVEDSVCNTTDSVRAWDLLPKFVQRFLLTRSTGRTDFYSTSWADLKAEDKLAIQELFIKIYKLHSNLLPDEIRKVLEENADRLLNLDYCFSRQLLIRKIHEDTDRFVDRLLNDLLSHHLDDEIRMHIYRLFAHQFQHELNHHCSGESDEGNGHTRGHVSSRAHPPRPNRNH